jgi:hypothetical protein
MAITSVEVLAGGDLGGGITDGGGHVRGQDAQVLVDRGGAALDRGQRPDQDGVQRLAGHREVLDRALGLRAPQCVRGHLDLAHRVVLGAESGPGSRHGVLLTGAR